MGVSENLNYNIKLGTNHNKNLNYNLSEKYRKSRDVEILADKLVEKLGNEQYRGFYCKVAWKLTEAKVWDNYYRAKRAADAKGEHPGKLFTYLCKRDGV